MSYYTESYPMQPVGTDSDAIKVSSGSCALRYHFYLLFDNAGWIITVLHMYSPFNSLTVAFSGAVIINKNAKDFCVFVVLMKYTNTIE